MQFMWSLWGLEETNVKRVRESSERQPLGVKATKNRFSSSASSAQAPPGQPTYCTACKNESCDLICRGKKTTSVAIEVKTEALWELL